MKMKTRLLHAWASNDKHSILFVMPTSLAEELPSVGAMHVLNAYGIASHEEAHWGSTLKTCEQWALIG